MKQWPRIEPEDLDAANIDRAPQWFYEPLGVRFDRFRSRLRVMTFATFTAAQFRLSRSVLYAVAHLPASIEAAAKSQADVVLFELEDAVPIEQKAQARTNDIAALGDLDWGEKTITVRVNALDSPFTFQDVIALLEASSANRIDCLFLPKVGIAADVYAFDVLVSQVERSVGRDRPLGFDLMVESTLGMANLVEICQASSRVESLQFGALDYARSAHMLSERVGGPHSEYRVSTDQSEGHLSDPFHYPISRVVEAARAYGKRPIDGPFLADWSNFDADPAGYEASARRGRVLGCEGKQALTPAQAIVANRVHSPASGEIERAQEIVSAAARPDRSGVVTVNGNYVDRTTIEGARETVAKAEKIARLG